VIVYEKPFSGEALPILRSEAVFPGTPEEVMSVVQSLDEEEIRKLEPDLADFELLERVNESLVVVYIRYNTPKFVTSRDSIFFRATKTLDDGTLVCFGKSMLHDKKPITKQYIRAKGYSAYFMIPVGKMKTRLIRLILVNPMGNIPTFVINIGKKKYH